MRRPSTAARDSPARPPSPRRSAPNGDGQADTATVSFTLSADANVTVDARWTRSGRRSPSSSRVAGGGRGRARVVVDGAGLPDGSYLVHVVAERDRRARGDRRRPAHRHAHARPGRRSTPAAFSPNGDGRGDTLDVTVLADRARDGDRADRARRPLGGDALRGLARPGRAASSSWDGREAAGQGAGRRATSRRSRRRTRSGRSRVDVPFLLDATAPTVRVVSTEPPRLWVSEVSDASPCCAQRRPPHDPRDGARERVRIARIERLRTLRRASRGTPRATSPSCGADRRKRRPLRPVDSTP